MNKGNEIKKLVLALPLLLIALTGCTAVTAEVEPTTSASSTAVAPEATDAPVSATDGSVEALLNEVPVSEEQKSDSYDRDKFNHWVSNNSTGCDTRYAVLVEESLTPAKTDGCKVISGEWLSSYYGDTFTDPSELDIDHMVPLSEAWRSGASDWDSTTREQFANDLGYAPALVAVSASSNRSKSDNDPSDWMPTTDGCIYVANWVAVKYRWNLTVDADEKDAILRVLSFCDAGYSIATPEKASAAPASTTAPVPAPEAAQPPVVAPTTPETAPVTGDGTTDPQFSSCKEANANGFGPYVTGDPEYTFYRDGDGDGSVCE